MYQHNFFIISTSLICILAAITAATGLYTGGISTPREFISIHGEIVQLDGRGVYANDSVSFAAQGRAQDLVTLIGGIPLLIISFVLVRRKSLRGYLLYTGTLAYFLYTYISYTFLVTYNMFFLLYVVLFSLSLVTLIQAVAYLPVKKIASGMSPRTPVKFLSIVLFFTGILLLFMWMGRILPALISNTVPYGLESYTTLGIQALDLGIIFPLAIVASVLLWKRKPWGFILAAILLFKGATMFIAIFAMIIAEYLAGTAGSIMETLIFLTLIFVNLGCTITLLVCVPKKAEVNQGTEGNKE